MLFFWEIMHFTDEECAQECQALSSFQDVIVACRML